MLLNINFSSEPIYGHNDKYIKSQIKIYGGCVNTDFQGKKMPKGKVPCKSLPIIMLDPAVKSKKKYCPQTLLEEPKKIKMENFIDNDLEKSWFDESDNKYDNDETESHCDNDESNE